MLAGARQLRLATSQGCFFIGLGLLAKGVLPTEAQKYVDILLYACVADPVAALLNGI